MLEQLLTRLSTPQGCAEFAQRCRQTMMPRSASCEWSLAEHACVMERLPLATEAEVQVLHQTGLLA